MPRTNGWRCSASHTASTLRRSGSLKESPMLCMLCRRDALDKEAAVGAWIAACALLLLFFCRPHQRLDRLVQHFLRRWTSDPPAANGTLVVDEKQRRPAL